MSTIPAVITPAGGIPAAVTASCQAGINRVKGGNGAPAAWTTIFKSTTPWSDPSFTSDNYFYWPSPFTDPWAPGPSITPAPTYQAVSTGSVGAVMYAPGTSVKWLNELRYSAG